jgi:hypothetical protein
MRWDTTSVRLNWNDVAGFVVEQIGDWTDRPRTIYIGDWKSLSTATEDHSL